MTRSDPPEPRLLWCARILWSHGTRGTRASSVVPRLVLGIAAGVAIGLGALSAGSANAPLTRSTQLQEETTRWLPPLHTPFTVTGPYASPPHPYASGHRGIDLRASPGASVAAPSFGTVSFAGNVAGRGVISVRVDERTVVSIEPVVSELGEGDDVRSGDVLGTVGTGGHCVGDDGTAECIHLGVRVDGAYVNPLRYFFGRPRLLPW